MDRKKIQKLLRKIDLHDADSQRWVIIGIFIALAILSVVIRKSFISFPNADYDIFASWYDTVNKEGISSFSHVVSNYNPPYTYFLYILTLLPLSKIVAIKGLMILFDLMMAAAVYLLVKVIRPDHYIPHAAALTSMFLPTVLFTGVMWGQFDQFYVAAILMSLRAALLNKSRSSWVWFGISIAIKFQAIFFLPVLVILSFKRIYWYDAFWGIVAFIALTIPPLFAGRSLTSLINIYPDQASLFSGELTLAAPNIYQWFPNSAFAYLNDAGILLAVVACAGLLLVALQRQKFSGKDTLILSALCLYGVPFLLPAMHDRYFFPAGIVAMVLAFAYPTRLYIGVAVAMQVIAIFSYSIFLFLTGPPVSFGVLALGSLVVVCILTDKYIGFTKQDIANKNKNLD